MRGLRTQSICPREVITFSSSYFIMCVNLRFINIELIRYIKKLRRGKNVFYGYYLRLLYVIFVLVTYIWGFLSLYNTNLKAYSIIQSLCNVTSYFAINIREMEFFDGQGTFYILKRFIFIIISSDGKSKF